MNTDTVLPDQIRVGDVIQSNSSPTFWLRVTKDPVAISATAGGGPDGEDVSVYEIKGVLTDPVDKIGTATSFPYAGYLQVVRRK